METKSISSARIHALDEYRGVALICMVIYHTLYDVTVFYPPFTATYYSFGLRMFQLFIGFSFTFIAGISSSFSRNNLRRGIVCFLCGMLLTVVTGLVVPDQIIVFGVLHMLGICMIVYHFIGKYLEKVNRIILFVIFFLLWAFLYNLSRGSVGLPGIGQISLPADLYQSSWAFAFGFPNASFRSADYYPVIPWIFLFLAGSTLGRPLKEGKFPKFCYNSHCPPLAKIGSHTMIIYLVHQPLIYGLFFLGDMIVNR